MVIYGISHIYLTNSSMPVGPNSRFIPFHDFFNLKTCLASSGSLESVGAGAAGSGNGSITSCSIISSLGPQETFLRIFLLVFAPIVSCQTAEIKLITYSPS